MPCSLFPVFISSLTSAPTYSPFSLNLLFLSSNVKNIFLQNGDASLFARPADKSDSCATTGTLFSFAPITTGSDTNPPFENTIFGLIFLLFF